LETVSEPADMDRGSPVKTGELNETKEKSPVGQSPDAKERKEG
jgi:hypothetical protein